MTEWTTKPAIMSNKLTILSKICVACNMWDDLRATAVTLCENTGESFLQQQVCQIKLEFFHLS